MQTNQVYCNASMCKCSCVKVHISAHYIDVVPFRMAESRVVYRVLLLRKATGMAKQDGAGAPMQTAETMLRHGERFTGGKRHAASADGPHR
jgi:hypothetical protein